MDPRGILLVVVSAAGFGVMAILAKDAAGTGATVTTVLAARFLIAAALFWGIAAARGVRPSQLPRGPVVATLAVGACVYAVESTVFFMALNRVDASIASLLLCTYPALVLVFAVLLRRETADARRVGALALAIGGALLVLAGGAGGSFSTVGIALTLASTVLYAVYVTLADGLTDHMDPITFGALLCTGAGVAITVGGTVSGRLQPAALADPGVLGNVLLMATVSTVLAVGAFVAGMRRIGASGASIVAGIEPVFTVALAAALLGETLTPIQVAGGLVVLVAISLVRGAPSPGGSVARGGCSPAARNAPALVGLQALSATPVIVPIDGPPAQPAPAAAARPLAYQPA